MLREGERERAGVEGRREDKKRFGATELSVYQTEGTW